MAKPQKVNINLMDVERHALEYIIDLVERDMNQNKENSIRGYSLFQAVNVLKNLLKQEIYLADMEADKATRQDTPKNEDKNDWHNNEPKKNDKMPPFAFGFGSDKDLEQSFKDMVNFFTKNQKNGGDWTDFNKFFESFNK